MVTVEESSRNMVAAKMRRTDRQIVPTLRTAYTLDY